MYDFFQIRDAPKFDPFWTHLRLCGGDFRIKIRSSLVRIDGSLFSYPKMSDTDGEFAQKEVKTGTPKI